MAVGAVDPVEPVELGTEVGAEVGAAAWGVAVADDPQATKNKSAIINDDNRMEPGFLKLWNMISEPPKFKTARIPRSPSRITNRMGCIKFR